MNIHDARPNGQIPAKAPAPKSTNLGELAQELLIKIVGALEAIARHNKGGSLARPEGLNPLNVSLNNGGEYEKGVCDAVLLIFGVISSSTEGRKAIHDFGFQALYQDVDRPRDSL